MIKTKIKVEPIILLVLFAIYLVVLYKITLFRSSNFGNQSVNLTPFVTITKYYHYILSGSIVVGVSNVLGNFIMFFPLGYITASLFPKMRRLDKILMLAFGLSMFIECSQYVFSSGSTDIDDVILNTLGGVAGYLIYAFIARFLKHKIYTVFMSTLMITVICLGFLSLNNYRFRVNRPIRVEMHGN